MHNNLNILEMKWVLDLQPFIPNANRLNIWQLNNLSHRLKDNLSNLFPQQTPNCGSTCEKVTGSNVIVLKGGSGGHSPPSPPPTHPHPGAKAFLLVTDNRRSRLDSLFCVITQHRKFEFDHHRQSKKISNAQELTITDFIFCYSTNQSFKQPDYKSHKKDLAPAPSSFFQFLISV